MKSQTLPSFWERYEELNETLKKQARKAFALWAKKGSHLPGSDRQVLPAAAFVPIVQGIFNGISVILVVPRADDGGDAIDDNRWG